MDATTVGLSDGVERLYREYHLKTVEYMLRADPNKRVRLGQFFTPKSLRVRLISKIPKLSKPKVLDPACGTGEFLLTAREYFIDPELYCWEVDPELARIAKEVVPEARVEVVDSLSMFFKEEFDVIVSNPPYFEIKPSDQVLTKFKEVVWGRVNIYSLFVYLGLKLLKQGGYLAYVISSSMNNGAYFRKLREFIVKNADIVYLEKIKNPHVFSDPNYRANHTFQLMLLKKGVNTGRYVFSHAGITIFTEEYEYLRKIYENSTTLKEMGYVVRTGRVVWNQHKDKLTNDSKKGVLLIWSHNISENGELILNNKPSKPQYIIWDGLTDSGPAIVVSRVVGHPSKARLRAALVPPNVKFLAENHVNVIYPPPKASLEELVKIVKWLNSDEMQKIVRIVTGNTQISKNELEKLLPIKI